MTHVTELRAYLERTKTRIKEDDDNIAAIEASKKYLLAEKARLERQIADSEVTYSIGDKFKVGRAEFLLARVKAGSCFLVNMDDGERLDGMDPSPVSSSQHITPDEMSRMAHRDDFTRTWDARKQEKC